MSKGNGQDVGAEINAELRRIFVDGKIKEISWGGEGADVWNAWDGAKRLDYAMKLASAMNQAAETLQGERDEALVARDSALASLKAADERMLIYRDTMQEAITANNALQQGNAKRIKELMARVKIQDKMIDQLNDERRP